MGDCTLDGLVAPEAMGVVVWAQHKLSVLRLESCGTSCLACLALCRLHLQHRLQSWPLRKMLEVVPHLSLVVWVKAAAALVSLQLAVHHPGSTPTAHLGPKVEVAEKGWLHSLLRRLT